MNRVVCWLLLAPAPVTAQATAPATLGMQEAIRLARTRVPAVAVAEASVREAEAGEREARGVLMPHVAGSLAATRQQVATALAGLPPSPGLPATMRFPTRSADVALQLPVLDVAGRRRLGAARETREAVAGSREAVADSVAEAAAYAVLARAHAEAVLAERLVLARLADSLVGLARRQKEIGTAAAIDVSRAEAQRAAARVQLEQARGDAAATATGVLRAVGLPLAQPLELTDSLARLTGGAAACDPLDAAAERCAEALAVAALARRPELVAADHRVRAARAAWQAGRAAWLPTVGVAGSYGAGGRALSSMPETYAVGVSLTWNAWDGGVTHARALEARAALDANAAALDDLRAAIEAEARTTAAALVSSAAVLADADALVRLAERELDDAVERFRAGLGGNLDVIAAQQGLAAARIGWRDAQLARARARVAAARAAGAWEAL